jgi:hypothetical protein
MQAWMRNNFSLNLEAICGSEQIQASVMTKQHTTNSLNPIAPARFRSVKQLEDRRFDSWQDREFLDRNQVSHSKSIVCIQCRGKNRCSHTTPPPSFITARGLTQVPLYLYTVHWTGTAPVCDTTRRLQMTENQGSKTRNAGQAQPFDTKC